MSLRNIPVPLQFGGAAEEEEQEGAGVSPGAGGLSPQPVLPHEGHDAGGGPRDAQEGVAEQLRGARPLRRVPHQHPLQEPLQGWGHLGGREGRVKHPLGLPRNGGGSPRVTLWPFLSRGGRLSRISFMALRGGSLK